MKPKRYAGENDMGEFLDRMYHDPKYVKNCFDGNSHIWKKTDRQTCKTKTYIICHKCGIRKHPHGGQEPIQV